MILEALTCLALNVYFEAQNQSTAGKLAVSHVVLNRVNSPRYPNDVCGVVQESIMYSGTQRPIRNQCQFSWYCDGKSDQPKNMRAWSNAMSVAISVLDGMPDITDGAVNYHATSVYPSWAYSKVKTTQIDDHIFYREKGN